MRCTQSGDDGRERKEARKRVGDYDTTKGRGACEWNQIHGQRENDRGDHGKGVSDMDTERERDTKPGYVKIESVKM